MRLFFRFLRINLLNQCFPNEALPLSLFPVPGSKFPPPERQAYSRRGLEELDMAGRWRGWWTPSSSPPSSLSYSQASSCLTERERADLIFSEPQIIIRDTLLSNLWERTNKIQKLFKEYWNKQSDLDWFWGIIVLGNIIQLACKAMVMIIHRNSFESM